MGEVTNTPKMSKWQERIMCWIGAHFGYRLTEFDQGEYGKVQLFGCARCMKVWIHFPYFEKQNRKQEKA